MKGCYSLRKKKTKYGGMSIDVYMERQNLKMKMFDHKSHDVERLKQFDDYVYKNLMPLFTYAEHVNAKIRVSDLELRSFLNGKHKTTFKSLANSMSVNTTATTKKHTIHQMEILTYILATSTTLNMLAKNVNDYLMLLAKEQFQWNRVYYGHYLDQVKGLNI